ncbi:hypothetical protein PGT21_006376 [Puccinia graminis f. sp. tritici]|uniref:Uncharacterized protein n=1 Tax=Puccinia graminis f. sp. tritici TaxID=56615 RepID=A0A5B0M3E8_PUCGR|nr:hypothetical protein PGT21_006376 [Puccinia graminis f. sp. tritici]KAA1090126.1 hypothetical protein PGTUg99_036120 [Puccinia graminis f. sp. tritici]
MAKDCQCHRLFYPTLIRSRSSNYVINSLKTKTTISPVITTLRTIGVMQRKKRKNEDDLLLKSKLSKPSYNNTINQLDSPIGKRTFPQERFESDYHQFKQAISISPEPQAFRLVSNGFFVGLTYDALIRPKQGKLAKRITTQQPELSHLSSNSTTTFTNIQSHDYERRINRHITITTTRNPDHHHHHHQSSHQMARENCGRTRKASFSVNNNPWTLRPIMSTPEQQSNSNPSPGDREQLIFTMSPFSSTQTLSTFIRSSATLPESHRSLKAFGRRKASRADDLGDESEDDEDERSISITSVLPIDIPQSHHKSN